MAALEASLAEADASGLSYDAALALDALVEVATPDDALRVVRRDGLFEQLGIVASPRA